MAALHIDNIPDDLYERLSRYALESNQSMNDVVLAAIERELARREWRKRLAQRPKTDLGVEAATLLHEERALRDIELALPDIASNYSPHVRPLVP